MSTPIVKVIATPALHPLFAFGEYPLDGNYTECINGQLNYGIHS